jgi:hypothetical protein
MEQLDCATIQRSQNIFKFLQKSYNESLGLLNFAHEYFSVRGKEDKLKMSKEDSLIYTLAMSTITTQLTSVFSWLLLCKAVESGEIKLEDLKSEDFRMAEFNLDLNDKSSCFAILNEPVSILLKQSSSLYNRVKRMENSIQQSLREVSVSQ